MSVSIPPAAVRRGFTGAEEFSALLSPHLPALFDTARRYMVSDDLAWDAVQETLARVWSRGWLPADPRPALRHLVVRSSLHLLRCERRRKSYEEQRPEAGPCCVEDPLTAAERRETWSRSARRSSTSASSTARCSSSSSCKA